VIDIKQLYTTVYGEEPTSSWLQIFKEMVLEDKEKIRQILLNVITENRAPLTNWRFVPMKKEEI
jgi:hypothetical protein